MSLNLYRWYANIYRQGCIEGLFLAEPEEIKNAIGKMVSLGEVLGKHSNIRGTLEEAEIMLVSDDRDFINQIFEHVTFSRNTLCGYNPLNYIQENCARCDDYFEPEDMIGIYCYLCEEEMQDDLEEDEG